MAMQEIIRMPDGQRFKILQSAKERGGRLE